MRCTFGYSLKQIAVASLFSCFVAGGICVLTSPSAANNAAAVSPFRSIELLRATGCRKYR